MLDIISHVPAHLTKALYIPKYDDTTSHFAIYDISKEYSEKVGVHPMGSESYKVELCLLRKPSGYHVGDNARFLVDVDASVSIHERVMGRDPLDAEVSSPIEGDGSATLQVHSGDSSSELTARECYPLPEKETKKRTIRYPYMSIDRDFGDFSRHCDWRVHPSEKGPLRYELVDRGRQGDDDGSILAIYHHHGFESELPTSYSHGVLLLPVDSTPIFDITVVSSLIALLATIRKQPAARKRSRFRSLMASL
ncbi:hypothetical protein FVEG_08455 [Fusarium verticillioides 7600]|uniref:Uncharacterized protein n=1 Tax=Gibberella moniliformis (strain M3125 / FGSC 7600) TaxID=334819 RepID=W7MCP8_GIBM7|nr:hypothetical protein FVEG_08455 [Fusarium verticillioides 7600]EWG48786.1 hypothetical protein FVEG_08455 [Fusarium verticillioides 7600]